MNNTTTTDNFEQIAIDAVTVVLAAAMTLKIIGGMDSLAEQLADEAEAFCERAIALGAE